MTIQAESGFCLDGAGLAALETRLREDMTLLCRPPGNWVAGRERDGKAVTDVVIVGAGMCGLVAWLALQTAGIRNVRIIDAADAGREGPWLTFARMEELRSPKQLTGPAFGYGALTFQAWFRARFGLEAWEEMYRIPRPVWMDYLVWYRKVLGVPVENGVRLETVKGDDELLRLELDGPGGRETVHARRLVMATGRDGMGYPTIPGFMDGVPEGRWAHSSDEIDFAALAGRRVAVIGVGASAVDNAAEALEAGAAEVRLLIRRREMPTINKLMGIGSYGFTAGFAELPDEWRWRIMNYSFVSQTPAPHGSTLRVSRHANAFFHFGKAVRNVRGKGAGLTVAFADGTALDTDFLILGTGFTVDPAARKELGEAADEVLAWRDAYRPAMNEENAELGRFPYLAADFSFQEKEPGKAPWLGRIHCYNYGATASLGKVSGDIPGVSDGADWLARAIAARLYAEDIDTHWHELLAYAKPELDGSEWRASPLPARDGQDEVA